MLQPIFTHRLIDKENAERGMGIHRGQVMVLSLCWRCEVGDLMTRKTWWARFLLFARLNVAVAQPVECGMLLIRPMFLLYSSKSLFCTESVCLSQFFLALLTYNKLYTGPGMRSSNKTILHLNKLGRLTLPTRTKWASG